jgi:spore coat protein CotH
MENDDQVKLYYQKVAKIKAFMDNASAFAIDSEAQIAARISLLNNAERDKLATEYENMREVIQRKLLGYYDDIDDK